MSRTAENIRRLRASGLTQTEISRRTKIPQHKLSRWESGRAPASADDGLVLQDLANAIAAEALEKVNQPNAAPGVAAGEGAHV